MKNISIYIKEAISLGSKSKVKKVYDQDIEYVPETKEELRTIIKELIQKHGTKVDLTNIDVSKIKDREQKIKERKYKKRTQNFINVMYDKIAKEL